MPAKPALGLRPRAPTRGGALGLSLGLGLVALAAGLGAALGLALARAPERLDLVHLAVFDGCQMRSYAWHWQNPQRLPAPLRYDFTKSPDSFVALEIWVHAGPTLSLSHRLARPCP